MQPANRQVARAVVMEAGADWPAFIHEGGGPNHWAIIPQQPQETPAELALRATARLAALKQRGASIDSLVIAVGPAHDDEIFASRCAVARALLRALDQRKDAELIFSASAGLADPARHELLALAGTLASQAQGCKLSVSVRFRNRQGVQREHPELPSPRAAQVRELPFVVS